MSGLYPRPRSRVTQGPSGGYEPSFQRPPFLPPPSGCGPFVGVFFPLRPCHFLRLVWCSLLRLGLAYISLIGGIVYLSQPLSRVLFTSARNILLAGVGLSLHGGRGGCGPVVRPPVYRELSS